MINDLGALWNSHKKNNVKGDSGESVFFKDVNEFRCNTCRDKGFYVKQGKTRKCTDCDGIPKTEDLIELSTEEVHVRCERLNIPEYYLTKKEFNPDILKTDETLDLSLRKDALMDFYIHQLKKIHDEFILGKKLSNSFIVMAPQGYGKSHFVYASMKECLKHGFTVCPYYDTTELVKMINYDDLKLKEVLDSDVCFIKMQVAFLTKKDTQAIKFILDKRARKNLPTIVISRFNMAYLDDIEPHLRNNFGLKHVDKGDYSKLKEVLGPYPKNYSKYADNK